MTYRALFIGGPLDGQERVTQNTVEYIFTEKRHPVHYETGGIDEMVYYTYQLLFAYGNRTLLYSLYESSESLDKLWEAYREVRQGS